MQQNHIYERQTKRQEAESTALQEKLCQAGLKENELLNSSKELERKIHTLETKVCCSAHSLSLRPYLKRAALPLCAVQLSESATLNCKVNVLEVCAIFILRICYVLEQAPEYLAKATHVESLQAAAYIGLGQSACL